jgi:Ca-activated chloride channel family protein
MRFQSPAYLALLALLPVVLFFFLRRPPKVTRARRVAFIAFRLLGMMLLILALSGVSLTLPINRLALAVLLDVSDSVGSEQLTQAMDAIKGIRARLRSQDTAILIPFGRDAVPQELARDAPRDSIPTVDVDRGATDIAHAMRVGIASLPEGAEKRIVLLSDGDENRGSAKDAAALAAASHAPVFAFPLSVPSAAADVRIRSILSPERVRVGEAHEFSVVLGSRTEAEARLSVLRDGQPLASWEGMLRPGETSISFTGEFADAGTHSYEARVESATDQIQENNQYRFIVEVAGIPSVLYVSAGGRVSEAFRAALTAQGIGVVAKDVSLLPAVFEEYLLFEAVIFDDVPCEAVTPAKMALIERYVGDAGGGFMMLGGEYSFGPGGYAQTPIEKILPIDMDVTQANLPRISLIVVADKSGSMVEIVEDDQNRADETTKLDLVKSAAFSAIKMLTPVDRVGLLAFDANFEWTLPLMDAGTLDPMRFEIASMRAGGGTDLYPALAEAYRVIASSPSPLHHIIIASDGITNRGEFETLALMMARNDVTVSTVAIGANADSGLLQKIAQWGGGRFYWADDPQEISSFFIAEMSRLNQGSLLEGSFKPRLVSANEIVDGIPLQSIPSLDGFILTYLKQGGEKVLAAQYDAPLLAVWRYGLGKSAAFTSDLKGRWGKAWVSWDAYSRFVAQLVRWVERPAQRELLHPNLGIADGKGAIAVDASDDLGSFINGLALAATVRGPDGKTAQIPIRQTKPGYYEGSFAAELVGDYSIGLSGSGAQGERIPPRTQGINLPYNAEFKGAGINAKLLAALAEDTGGLVLRQGDVGQWDALYNRTGNGPKTNADLWLPLVIACLVLLLLDILARQISLPRRWAETMDRWRKKDSRQGGRSRAQQLASVNPTWEAEKRKMGELIREMTAGRMIGSDLRDYIYVARLSGRETEKGDERSETVAKSREIPTAQMPQ